MITETLIQTDPMFFYNFCCCMVGIEIIGMIFIIFGLSGLFTFRRNVSIWFILIVFGAILLFGGAYGNIWANDQRPYVTITPTNSWDSIETQNITSLSDGSSYSMDGHGSFFLGSDRITMNGETTMQYIFYKVTPDGYQIGTLDATDVFIREDENMYPYIEWDYTHTTAPLKRWSDTGEIDSAMNGMETHTLTKTIIHVPNGTVIDKDYMLDLEV